MIVVGCRAQIAVGFLPPAIRGANSWDRKFSKAIRRDGRR
jgi:hypothetical protein